MNKIRLVVASLLLGAATGFAQKPFNASGTGNPIIPGYFADPTVKKFGDTYYMYATTDGSGAGFGPAQVWTSKDFVNWTLMPCIDRMTFNADGTIQKSPPPMKA